MNADAQAAFQAAADDAIAWSTEQHLARETELVDFLKGEGLEIYAPDVEAFRAFAQQKYLESDLSKDWPAGMLERINAL
jgi:TRAP-type C4-dicarboxylate transport system substrate-binding protein